MYGFTDSILLNEIIHKNLKGINTRIILEQHPYKSEKENDKVINTLRRQHINWHGSIPPYRLVHQKAMIIDNRIAMIMTFNFTHSTFKKERNFGLIIDDPEKVKEINSAFNSDWNHSQIKHTNADLIWSPIDSRQKLLNLINQSSKEIKIYAENINDLKLIQGLIKKSQQGVKIKILTSLKFKRRQPNDLAGANIAVRDCKKYYIHAKAMIIDNRIAVIGSINLTRSSLEDNRELSVITHDQSVVKELNRTFDRDWQT